MKVNLPVTGREHLLPPGITLMSTTDTRGHIQYANDAFVSSCGYTEQQLQGQPHNIVRHPDMPEQAFGDMWRTLKAGEPWTGLVKNRRQDGDHYWVRANAMPIVRGGQVQAYMSVRTAPSRAEIDAAQDLYACWRAGRQGARAFHKGLVVATGWWRWRSLFQTASVRARLRMGVLCAVPLQVAVMYGLGLRGQAWWLGAAACTGLALLSLVYLELQITRPLQSLREQALRVASGDTQAVDHMNRVDEIGMTLRVVGQLGLMLRWLIDDVSGQVLHVRSATQDIAQGNSDLSVRTENAAASVQRTTASMAQVSASLRQTVQAAQEAEQGAGEASQAARAGGQAVGSFVATMGEIAQSSRRVQDIIGVIDDIAAQTNILALNAAVEAARAGEQGRGFSVVAGEVRSLAQRSAEAAKEIKGLIHTSVLKVGAGTRLVGEAGQAMDTLVQQVGHVCSLIGDISQASQAQSRALERVGEDVHRLDAITQQNAALVEQGTAASQSLNHQARRLADAVQVFR